MCGRRSSPRCWRFTITFAVSGRTVDDFDRLLSGELEPAAESDRGAVQLLEQTRFLAAAFRAYEARLDRRRRVDEHAARARLLSVPSPGPCGIWSSRSAIARSIPTASGPPMCTMFTTRRRPRATSIVLATDGVLDAGYLDRLQLAFVEIEEA